MNERIKELLEQAKTESSQWLGSKPATTITYDELEKFAELIIKECAAAVAKANNPLGRNIDKVFEMHFGAK